MSNDVVALIRPKNLIHHELIGLELTVEESRDPTLVGIRGTIIDESRNMIAIMKNERIMKIPKQICVFKITLPDGSKIRIIGKNLVERPENRLKKTPKGIWKIW